MAETPGAAWTITAQTETTDLSDQGMYVPGVKVSFRTARGINGSVFVKADDYRPERVRELVGAKAAIADEIAGMAG